MRSLPRFTSAAIALFSILATASITSASTIQIPVGAFGPASSLLTFTGLAFGTEVNGLTVGGITFQYSLGNGHVVIGDAIGGTATNNLSPPYAVSIYPNDPTGVLTLMLPSLVDQFGFGHAVLGGLGGPDATTVSLFNGATLVGSQTYPGSPDPFYVGGFAGVQSTLPFNRVQLVFPTRLPYLVDNVRTQPAVPEPATFILLSAGVLAVAYRRRRRTS